MYISLTKRNNCDINHIKVIASDIIDFKDPAEENVEIILAGIGFFFTTEAEAESLSVKIQFAIEDRKRRQNEAGK